MIRQVFLASAVFLLCWTLPALAFDPQVCGPAPCGDCHKLTPQEANQILQGGVDKVLKVELAEMPGTWLVEVEKNGQKFPLFIDFSKKYLVAGTIYRIADKHNIAAPEAPKQIDPAKIPLEDAVLLGDPMAATQAIVFTDPQCPYCKKLHANLQEVVQRDRNIAFRIKLFPLKIHPKAYGIAKSIVCANSLELLEKSFADQPVPEATCETQVVDQNIALAHELGIISTPTLILPDGSVVQGARSADELLRLLGSKVAPAPPKQ